MFKNYIMALFRDSDTLKKIGKSEIYNGIIKILTPEEIRIFSRGPKIAKVSM